jgi:hypothetical protein
MLVLCGNIPRFPWQPSTTMLSDRLKGTTEHSASNRNGHPNARTRPAQRSTATHLRSPRRAPKVLYVAEREVRARAAL